MTARGGDANEVYPFRFTCRRSGNCCSRPAGFVRVDDDDVARIADHLGMTESGFRARYVTRDGAGQRLVDGFGTRCVFLEEGREASCSIYPVRPERCATWPYWPELRDDPAVLAEAMRLCPGIVSSEVGRDGAP